MRRKISTVVATFVLLASVGAGVAGIEDAGVGAADRQPQLTMILVKNMHCASCAKKIAAKLYGVSGVYQVRADVKKNATYVAPRQQQTPSPRKMWEAVETAGFEPIKLVGPAGVFTSRPPR